MVHLIEVIGFSSPKLDPTFPVNGYSQKMTQTDELICSDARRRTLKFSTFFLGPNCGATIRTYSGSAKAPPYVDKFRRTETAMLTEMRLAHSTTII